MINIYKNYRRKYFPIIGRPPNGRSRLMMTATKAMMSSVLNASEAPIGHSPVACIRQNKPAQSNT